MNDRLPIQALSVVIEVEDGRMTIGEYLKSLLLKFWDEKDCFNSKRPFGNGDWDYNIYTGLIREGFIDGKLDSDGFIDELDTEKASEFVSRLIHDYMRWVDIS